MSGLRALTKSPIQFSFEASDEEKRPSPSHPHSSPTRRPSPPQLSIGILTSLNPNLLSSSQITLPQSFFSSANPSSMADSGEVCNFFRKPTKNKNIRKRKTTESSDDDDDDDEAPQPSSSASGRSKKPVPADNKLHFSTARSSSRPSADAAGDDADEAAGGRASALFHFESAKEIQVQHDSRATATLETETDFSKDARAIRERVLKQAEAALKGKSKGDDKVYRGIHGYTDYKAGFRREHTVAGEKAGGAHGPLRASAHIRSSARFDYQPDICKDYKETGYCGFGDACKFMHDRGDYKSGWQLEKEWEEVEKARKRGLALGRGGADGDDGGDEDDDDDDSLPFACFICRQPFEDPVVTNCNHYFCEHCALKV